MTTAIPAPRAPDMSILEGEFYARDPHPYLCWMREHAPLYHDDSGVWGVTLYEDIIAMSKEPKTFCSKGGIRPDADPLPHMIDQDGAKHRRRRALISKGFTPRQTALREARIRQLCIDLIERARELGEFDFVEHVAAQLPLIVIGDMLGVEEKDHADLLRWSDDMVSGTGPVSPEKLERATQSFVEYDAYQRRVIADRRARPRQDDLMSILVHAEIDGEKLDDDTLVADGLLILIGGDETTRHVISGGMHQLFRHPDQRRLLASDPSKIPTAVEEMLRWVTPIQNMCRTATRDVELRGQKVKKGDKLLLLYPSANRDERVFSDPFAFDVERQPNDHLAFGFGQHFCLGASLARLEIRVMFEELLRRLPTLELASNRPLPKRPSNFITGLEEMPVVVR